MKMSTSAPIYKIEFQGITKELAHLKETFSNEDGLLRRKAEEFQKRSDETTRAKGQLSTAKRKLEALIGFAETFSLNQNLTALEEHHAELTATFQDSKANITAKKSCIESSNRFLQDCKTKREGLREKDVALYQRSLNRSREMDSSHSKLMTAKDRKLTQLRQDIIKSKVASHELNSAIKLQRQEADSNREICTQENALLTEKLLAETKSYEDSERLIFSKRTDNLEQLKSVQLLQIDNRQKHPRSLDVLRKKIDQAESRVLTLQPSGVPLTEKSAGNVKKLTIVSEKLNKLKGILAQIGSAESQSACGKASLTAKQTYLTTKLAEFERELREKSDLYATSLPQDQKELTDQDAMLAKLTDLAQQLHVKLEQVRTSAKNMVGKLDRTETTFRNAKQTFRNNTRYIAEIQKWKRKFDAAKKNPLVYFHELKKQLQSLENKFNQLTLRSYKETISEMF